MCMYHVFMRDMLPDVVAFISIISKQRHSNEVTAYVTSIYI